jgi:hypothetical protein
MRTTKLLLAAAAIAAGIVSTQAQSNVYSVNIVGYVNVPLQGGGKLDILDYPLNPPNSNLNITNVIKLADANDGALLLHWAGNAWDNSIPSWIAGGFGWDTEMNINAGESYFINAPAADTVTFVGEVRQGTMTNTIPAGLSFQANKVPNGAPWPGGTVGHDSDIIYLWTGTAWANTIWSYVDQFGWDDGLGGSTNGPSLVVGRGGVYLNGGAPIVWVQTFTAP